MARKLLGVLAGLVLLVLVAAALGLLLEGMRAGREQLPAAMAPSLTPQTKPEQTPPAPTPTVAIHGTPQPPPERREPGPLIQPSTPTPIQVTGPVVTINIPGKEFGKYSPNSKVIVSARWGKGEGEYGLQLSGGRGGASALGIDAAGNIYVLDSENRRVHMYDPQGRILASVPVGPSHDIAVKTDGGFYLLDAATDFVVRSYAPDGKAEATYPIVKELANYPIGITGLLAVDQRVSIALGSGAHALVKSELGPIPPEAQRDNQFPGQPSRAGSRFIWAGRLDETSAFIKIFRPNGIVENQIRVTFERRVASPYVVTNDAGEIYLCAYLFLEGGPPRYETLSSQMVVVALTAQGQLLGKVEAPNINLTEAWKPIVVSPSGSIYQRQASREGVAIVRWEMER